MQKIEELRGTLRPPRSPRRRPRRLHARRPAPPPQPAAPSSLETGELPESYGVDKVVVLPVNPYLVHVYWDLAPDHQHHTNATACLRFSEAGSADSFDVNVDLAAKSWYVPLWSPEKRYSVELGLTVPEGGFISLARSNPVETPRAWPVAEVQEQFRRVDNTGPAGGIPTPPPDPALPAIQTAATPPLAVVGRTPWSARVPLDPPAEPSLTTESSGTADRSAASDVPSLEERPFPPPDAAAVLRQRLTELYALRWWREPAAGISASAIELPLPAPRLLTERVPAGSPLSELLPPRPELPGDLTIRTEQRFSSGFSSSLLALHPSNRPAD